jgi:uncharacterized protein (TIGR03437 family)
LFLAFTFASIVYAQPQIGGGTCTTASLTGNYWLSFNARNVSSSGTFQGVVQQLGLATFDGAGNFTVQFNQNSNTATGQTGQIGGTVNISSDCSGTLSVTSGANGTASLAVYNGGNTYNTSGASKSGAIGAGTGGIMPSACLTSTLSGAYAINANGFTIASSAVTGVADFNGVVTFDGAGNATSNVTVSAGGNLVPVSSSGTYAMNTPSACQGTLTLANAAFGTFNIVFAVTNSAGNDFQFIATAPTGIFQGAGHAVFHNPGQSVTNGASFISGEASPGSIFSIFGENLGPSPGEFGSTLPLPTTVGGTLVTVNGKDVPIFYAGSGQINAQMPVDATPGLATVVVSSGNATSNAAAVSIPQAAPGIFTYGPNNHAVVINPHGHLNDETVPAHVGDTVVVYFTGGGPVTASGAWTTGAAAPLGASPVTESNAVTVNGKAATISYIGLTGGSVGLYQANFVVPQVIAGDHPLAITVNGVKSKAATITVAE